MYVTTLIAAALLAAPNPIQPRMSAPVSVVVAGKDLVFIRSAYPITQAYLAEPTERYSHFVDYGPDRQLASVLLRTKHETVRLIVEVSVRGSGLSRQYEFVLSNPSLARR